MSQPKRATYEVQSSDGAVRVRVAGEIDMSVADDLRQWITHAMACHPGDDVEVDFGGVTFIDSTGVRALVLACRGATASGVTMRLTGSHGRVQMVLRMTGVYEMLTGG